MRIGLLGGTFDPIHNGHLAAAAAAQKCAGLTEVLLVPAGVPPHKDKPHASALDRLEMCRLAAAGTPGLGVWDLEVGRPGRSFTIDTVRAFIDQRPGDIPLLLIGWDAAVQFRTWHRWEELLALIEMVVFPRPGLPEPAARDLGRAGLGGAGVILCEEVTPEVSATELRSLLTSGANLAGLVPPAVEAYIREHGLYGSRVGG